MTTLMERIKKESNMVGISNIIMQDVFYYYCQKFANEYRPFNRKKETQESWTNSLFKAYSVEIKKDRVLLFNSIPDRFKKSIMYKNLENSLNN
jgi:hypothetical protein